MVAVIMTALALVGCAPGISDLTKRSAARAVEHAQDLFWDHRRDIVVDPEGTISALGFVSDVRPGKPLPDRLAQYALMDVRKTDRGPAITLLAEGSAETGGGLWYEQRSGAVCFTLTFEEDGQSIRTTPAPCTEIPQLADVDDIYSLDELNVRLEVTPEDYPPPVCRCYSGSECDCPGG